MAKYSRLQVLNSINRCGIIPIYFHPEEHVAQQILKACVAGGAQVVEFTNRGDGAWQIFSSLLTYRQNNQIEVVLGAGSIVDVATAALFINNGADFIVGPSFNEDIAKLCNRRKVAYIPGCATLNEIAEAEASGAEFVKIFPGNVLGPEFIRAVHGPMPWTNMVVTGGVSPNKDELYEWFSAGVTAVGIGSTLLRREWVANGQYLKITENIVRVLEWIARFKFQPQD